MTLFVGLKVQILKAKIYINKIEVALYIIKVSKLFLLESYLKLCPFANFSEYKLSSLTEITVPIPLIEMKLSDGSQVLRVWKNVTFILKKKQS